jgi:hypothetical protein
MKQFTVLLDDDLYDFIEQWSTSNDRSFSESVRHGLRIFFLPATSPEKTKRGRNVFEAPELEEIRQYSLEKGYSFEPEAFHAFYESKGWRIGNQPMRNWKAACLTWQKRKDEVRSTRDTVKNAVKPYEPLSEETRETLRKQMEELDAALPEDQRRIK